MAQAQQNCDLILTGSVIDNHDDQPLVGAVVRLGELTTVTNVDGAFVFTDLCAQSYEITISHLYCDDYTENIAVNSSFAKTFYLEHHEDLLEEIEIQSTAKRGEKSKASTTLTGEELLDKQGKSFGEMLEDVEGISLLKTGATITKPVINGLHSQRILMVNHGMRMEGQQWGLEHAPEIDPYAVQTVSVIQGAGSVEYGADALGGVVLVEPAPLPDFYGTTFKPSLIANSNGRGGAASLNILGKQRVFGLPLSFQAQGSVKKSGNLKAPNYYLDNSGVEEASFITRAGYVGDHTGVELSLSQFNNHLGILTDSHIGNENDLLALIENGRPFVDRGFSYDILRPRQEILHEIAQAKAYHETKIGRLEMNVSRQYNRRSEYDRSNYEPGIRLKTETYTESLHLKHNLGEKWDGKAGVELQQQDFRANGFYLIPEYQQRSFGAFLYENYTISEQWLVEAGLRYDKKKYTYYLPFREFTRLDESEITYDEINGAIGTLTKDFKDLLTGSAGISFTPNKSWTVSSYWGYGARQPLPNELYSDGVHHGTALWEIGNPSLEVEKANNIQFNTNFEQQNTEVNVNLYANLIDNYSYLFPSQDLDPIFTIRGNFPVYETRQSDVEMLGVNYSFTQREIFKHLDFKTGGSFLRAEDKTLDDALIYMPANRLHHEISYQLPKQWYLKMGMQNVFEQKRVPNESIIQDFVEPPAGYNLLDLEIGGEVLAWKHPLKIAARVDNLTNKEYKDYLDRFRYFAHAPGINFGLRMNYDIFKNQ